MPPSRFFHDARTYGVETVFRATLHAAAPELARELSGARADRADAQLPRPRGLPPPARTDRGGRSSATPDTSRTRSPRTASPTRCATPRSSRARCSRRETPRSTARTRRPRAAVPHPDRSHRCVRLDAAGARRTSPEAEADDRRRSRDAQGLRREGDERRLNPRPFANRRASTRPARQAALACSTASTGCRHGTRTARDAQRADRVRRDSARRQRRRDRDRGGVRRGTATSGSYASIAAISGRSTTGATSGTR